MKKDKGGLQPQEKMEIILKVLIGLYLINKLDRVSSSMFSFLIMF